MYYGVYLSVSDLGVMISLNRLKNMDTFQEIHIDIARNSTDDFNLFHDKHRWHKIHNNPFNGPIVLGFELEALIEHKLFLYRQQHNEQVYLDANEWRYSNYQFNFSRAVKPGQTIEVDIKESQLGKDGLSNRISVKADGNLCLLGFKKESKYPLFLSEAQMGGFGDLSKHSDRSFVFKNGEQEKNVSGYAKDSFFLKRKFINTSNAKNFLCGSLVEQIFYFDELQNKFNFPEIFPTALISCALLEKFMLEKLNFEINPVVYTSHKITVDRLYLSRLKSNDVLHILVQRMESDSNLQHYECYGLTCDNNILFRALISLIPLAAILKPSK